MCVARVSGRQAKPNGHSGNKRFRRTKVSKAIKSVEDKTKLQRDLNSIYKWAEECRMEFNGNKFEQITHGETVGVEYGAYINLEGRERDRRDG